MEGIVRGAKTSYLAVNIPKAVYRENIGMKISMG